MVNKFSSANYKKRINDSYYTTDPKVVNILLPYLKPNTKYIEPCAGAGDLIKELDKYGHKCTYACDIDPKSDNVKYGDLFSINWYPNKYNEIFITNPPWTRKILHPLINHLSDLAPTWLLFDAAWMHTKQSSGFIHRCKKIISVGRVCWFPETKKPGMHDCAWYLFDKLHTKGPHFYGRR